MEKVVVVLPAYNAANTLEPTLADLDSTGVDEIIVVDDASTDNTVEIARRLPVTLIQHERNRGYGANQKTCYIEALKSEATIIVMVHPDYQYDPSLVPEIVAPIINLEADIVLGSRMLRKSAFKDGMPWWKFIANKSLTWLENKVFGLSLSEYHTGYRAYSRHALESVNFYSNSDGFVFDQEIIAQFVWQNLKISEVPVPVRYFPEASSAGFVESTIYGIKILWLLVIYGLHKFGIVKSTRFSNVHGRYESSPK